MPSRRYPLLSYHRLSHHPLASLVLQAPGPSLLLFRSRPSRLAKELKNCGPRYKPLVLAPMSLKPKFLQDPLVTTGCVSVRLTLERKPKGWPRTYKSASHNRYRITGSFPTRCGSGRSSSSATPADMKDPVPRCCSTVPTSCRSYAVAQGAFGILLPRHFVSDRSGRSGPQHPWPGSGQEA